MLQSLRLDAAETLLETDSDATSAAAWGGLVPDTADVSAGESADDREAAMFDDRLLLQHRWARKKLLLYVIHVSFFPSFHGSACGNVA